MIVPCKVRKGKKYSLDSTCDDKNLMIKRACKFRKLGFKAFVQINGKEYYLFVHNPSPGKRIRKRKKVVIKKKKK